jgi:hypothetical protein
METLIGLATSALRSVRMAVELMGVGLSETAPGPALLAPARDPEDFIDFEAQERFERDLLPTGYDDSPLAAGSLDPFPDW